MKKNNNKGFMLTETLVVSTLIVSILIYLYLQFTNVYNNYQNSFIYNTPDALYNCNNIKTFLINDNIENIIKNENLTNNYYVDLKTYTNYNENNYKTTLFSFLDVNEVILTKDNLTDIKNNLGSLNFSVGLKNFIKYTKSTGEENVYRLFVSYNNGTYASINLLVEE